ncbi:IS1380 family transposase [Streptomyces sp. P17]|uniref:IS1380 family transposase n=1 Tax=Streptomyces sp. P17 TaxID=3074716 RepID=UPI0028F45746|nr:IS1380 family transposase [Streptomyces sp. P17]MDT9701457.1 IS1380 family transposase [Streptomyces sp. P17]
MREPISSYPRVRVQDDGRQVVSQAGSVLLVETVRKTGLDQAISQALAQWRKPRAVHDPGKVLLDVALAVALGGAWKKTYGHHPLTAFLDHGPGGTGEPVAALLRPGNAGSNTAADHITATRLALAQLPKDYRRGRQTLICTDSAGGTHEFVSWLAQRGRWLSYSVGMTITEVIHQHALKISEPAWTPAVETDGEVRDGAWVAELTGDVLESWPQGMRLIVRKKRPHPGAQLRFTDTDGMRLTCFATNTADRPIAELELRHRLRARAEDRIRAARATGLRNLPLHDMAQNRVWLEIVQIALDLLAWMPMLALTGKARLWEPRRLRFRLFTAAAQLVTTGRRRILRLARHWPWTREITAALARLALLPNPG